MKGLNKAPFLYNLKTKIMMQVQQLTRDEKVKMFMKLSRRELAELLISSNELLENSRVMQIQTYPVYPTHPTNPIIYQGTGGSSTDEKRQYTTTTN